MIRASEAETYEMMRAGHDLVMKMGIQEAFEASNLVGAAAGSEGGIHKAAPIVIHHGKVAQNLSRRQSQSGTKLIGAKFQTQILCFASANRTLGFARNRKETAAGLVFVNPAPEQIGQGAGNGVSAQSKISQRRCGKRSQPWPQEGMGRID